MSYKLTLTSRECQAVYMMAGRYSGATYLADMLDAADLVPDGETTLDVAEHVAWGLAEAAREDMEGGHRSWPCFAPELVNKLDSFCDSIV